MAGLFRAGYTVVDKLTGTMRQGWRLDMHAPYTLAGVRTEANDWLRRHNAPQGLARPALRCVTRRST